jgi:hypothetical protein
MSLREYIQHSSEKVLNERKEYHLFNRIYVYIKDPLPQDINLTLVIQRIENTIPEHLTQDVDSIFIGQFEELIAREVEAVYDKGTIYLTNVQDDDDDIFDDIVHEIAHSIENWAGIEIYGDGAIEREFTAKRKKLFAILKSLNYDVQLIDFLDTEYSKNFDFFLYKTVGYDKLNLLTVGLFPSAYSATSIREYFAIGFEEYLYGDRKELKLNSPFLYERINQLINPE